MSSRSIRIMGPSASSQSASLNCWWPPRADVDLADALDVDDLTREDDVLIVVHEPPLESWGIRRGRSAAEVELGFDV